MQDKEFTSSSVTSPRSSEHAPLTREQAPATGRRALHGGSKQAPPSKMRAGWSTSLRKPVLHRGGGGWHPPSSAPCTTSCATAAQRTTPRAASPRSWEQAAPGATRTDHEEHAISSSDPADSSSPSPSRSASTPRAFSPRAGMAVMTRAQAERAKTQAMRALECAKATEERREHEQHVKERSERKRREHLDAAYQHRLSSARAIETARRAVFEEHVSCREEQVRCHADLNNAEW